LEFLEVVFLKNTVETWLIGLAILILSFLILRIVKGILYRRIFKLAKKTSTDLDDLVAKLIGKMHTGILFLISIYFASLILELPTSFKNIFDKFIIVVLLVQTAILGTGLIQYWVERYKKKKITEDATSVTQFTALGFVLRFVLWIVIALLILDNLGVEITTLVAGLGIGGIAVALAVQNILGDLFASVSIVLDKPFVIGDFIIVDNFLGSVEHIGLKTTRLRSVSGEQLVMSNSDLLKSRIRNYKRMYERRILFTIGVIYQTPLEKLKSIPNIVKEVIETKEEARFDRAHFKEYGNFSLNFEIVYWVQSPDYAIYMNIQQAINLEIYQRFEEQGIEFAYPTQTLFMAKEHDSQSTKET
jgi:small-conductance mechanosensitive channel